VTAYDFTAQLWVWDARRTDRWTFVSLPTDIADEVLERGAAVARGFGSLRVRVSVGTSVWTTSIFPADKAGTYVLPVKKAIRAAQGVEAGDSVDVHLELVDV
jgi:hypothetical protein